MIPSPPSPDVVRCRRAARILEGKGPESESIVKRCFDGRRQYKNNSVQTCKDGMRKSSMNQMQVNLAATS